MCKRRRFLGRINREDDFIDLNVARRVAEVAGLIRKYKGRFIHSRDCRKLLSENSSMGLFPRLFRAYVQKYNWGYWDGYPDINFIQQSFLFTLYLLHLYGDEWRSSYFYEDNFLRAFPRVIDQVPDCEVLGQKRQLLGCYRNRAIFNFLGFLGLASVEPVDGDNLFADEFRIKKLPMFDYTVQFLTSP